MKKLCLLIVFSIVISILSGCGGTRNDGESQKRKTIKISHCHQADFSSELHTAAWIFQQWVNERSRTLEVKIYPSNGLGQEREVYEGMQLDGGASCIVSGSAILSNFNKKVGVLDLPFLWDDYEHVHRVLDGDVGRTISAELETQGFVILAWVDSWGYRNVVTSDREVKTVDDLKGLKLRTIETPIYIAAVNAMGANATPMAFGEIYTSLQTGILDGFEHNSAAILANKYYEVADHISLTRHLFGPVVFAFSKAEWDELSDEERQVVREGAEFARDVERALAPVRDREALESLVEHGMTITDIDMSEVKANAAAIQDELAAERDATGLLEMIRAAR